MIRILTCFLTLSCISASAQTNPTEEAQPIVAEGKALYRSEMASWYGTDLFLENYKDRKNIGGYFSYMDEGLAKCIFFSAADSPQVIGTISFDSTYKLNTADVNLSVRGFTELENELYEIRKSAWAAIRSDSMFRRYENTRLNLIPLINGSDRKVYVLTATNHTGVVIFGNDYLLTFDKSNNLLKKESLHKNLIPIQFGEKEHEGKQAVGAMHSHLPETGDFITATDICTLMLYGKLAKWEQHIVISQKYMNIWNCATEQLTVIPRDVVDKIDKDQRKKAKKDKKPKKD